MDHRGHAQHYLARADAYSRRSEGESALLDVAFFAAIGEPLEDDDPSDRTLDGVRAAGLRLTGVEAIDHLDLVVSSLERSLTFYRGLLGPLGYVHEGDIVGERGERVVYLSRHGGGGSVSLREAQSPAHPAPYDRYALGLHHLAFAASGRPLVDGRAAWAHENGVEVESEPREYDYTPGYYAVFLHDPDGIKLEIVHRPSERDLTRRVRELTERLEHIETQAGTSRPGA